MDDTEITAKVRRQLIEDRRVKAREVEVKTYKGIVTLGGFVETPEAKQAAEMIAMNVNGVTKVGKMVWS